MQEGKRIVFILCKQKIFPFCYEEPFTRRIGKKYADRKRVKSKKLLTNLLKMLITI